jgi:hypothetical protein
VLFVAAIGCGEDRPGPVAASGLVTLDGTPLSRGTIRVVPADGRAATAKIGPDGRFILTTHNANDGCLPGTHAVEVVAQQITGNENSEDAVVTWIAPARYANQATSGLTVTVSGPTDSLVIELSSKSR